MAESTIANLLKTIVQGNTHKPITSLESAIINNFDTCRNIQRKRPGITYYPKGIHCNNLNTMGNLCGPTTIQ